jgi:hypothetical protein
MVVVSLIAEWQRLFAAALTRSSAAMSAALTAAIT